MASVISICNTALTHVRTKRIRSLLDDSEEARLCNLFYEDARDEVLQSHPWNCASKRASLARLSDAPAWGFANAYALPSDCLRVLRMENHRSRWKIESGNLLTDEGTAKVLYIRRIDDPNQFPPLVAQLIAYRLAITIAPRLAKADSLIQYLKDDYEKHARTARSADAQEGAVDQLIADDYLIDRAVGPVNPYGPDVDY